MRKYHFWYPGNPAFKKQCKNGECCLMSRFIDEKNIEKSTQSMRYNTHYIWYCDNLIIWLTFWHYQTDLIRSWMIWTDLGRSQQIWVDLDIYLGRSSYILHFKILTFWHLTLLTFNIWRFWHLTLLNINDKHFKLH